MGRGGEQNIILLHHRCRFGQKQQRAIRNRKLLHMHNKEMRVLQQPAVKNTMISHVLSSRGIKQKECMKLALIEYQF
ncbi:hypothetical protein DPMN_150284 [Dreissena polymorpha]|uniref:Uncharacterized protein n=1 Tax=Dreissena polymorpha TaxID=45954 RepID=A0A9D4J378_DREPO|nr:hypothetical protein DPMN_150284 [Dreissena polymorpha]